jgi:topoisomerase-4 subunit A
LAYRSGDKFAQAVRGRTNETLVFLDSHGRTYNTPAHSLPSARGQGEPLTGRFKPKDGARFVGVMMGDSATKILLASNAGFGFVGPLADMVTKNKAGKACLSVPAAAEALAPIVLDNETLNSGGGLVAAVTNQGRLLIFKLADLPELSRGKGNKLINIPSAAFKAGDEAMLAVAVLGENDDLVVHAGQRHLTMKRKDYENYIGERARRGSKLPRGFQKVDRLTVG